MVPKLEISRSVRALILAEAARDPRVEACGLLLGDGLRIDEVVPCRNVGAEPAISFEVDPAQLLAAHKAARNGGPAVVGCWHSHPNGRAGPSARDAAAAESGSIWIIAAEGQLGAWRMGEQGFAWLSIAGCAESAGSPQEPR